MLNVLIAGQKFFGYSVFNSIYGLTGVQVAAVSCPIVKCKEDKLHQIADQKGVKIIKAGTLNAGNFPENIDLIVTAHSHDFIGEKTRFKSKYGGIGYHPSMLPIHRGRDAVKWAVRMGDKITGGTVYRLSNTVDGGNIILQEPVFIRRGDTAEELWRRDLCPMGVRLLTSAVGLFRDDGFIAGVKQDSELATWEPSLDAPPIPRPDLIMLGRD